MGKHLAKQTTHTEVDLTTGEISRIIHEEQMGYIDTEPEYVKVYIGTQLCLNSIDPSLAPYIIAFSSYLTYANDEKYQHMIQTNSLVREGVAKTLGVTEGRVKQIINKLVDSGIFIPIYTSVEENGVVTRKKKRGLYFVNPWVVAKGSWKDIKNLQQNIDFVKGTSSYTIADNEGTRKINIALPNLREGQQLSLSDYGEGEE